MNRRKVILNYPPVSSVWHLPVGVAQLAAVLQQDGHEVLQRYSHITGLDHVLLAQDPSVQSALSAVRNPHSNILELYDARRKFEQVSRSVSTPDQFSVERNNVSYVSVYYDGTIERALAAVADRESTMWYNYFLHVELPLVTDFQPDVYGISVSDERQFVQGCILASLVKDFFPNILVVLGGNFWGRVTRVFSHPKFTEFFKLCDCIVYKEGFQPLQSLVATLQPELACGTAWRDGDRVVLNPVTPTPTVFETLPTPVFDGGAQQWSPDTVLPLYTMSNCPMACGFCAIAAGSDTFLQRPRAMSPARIAWHMAQTGASRFDITDEIFSIQRQLALGEELRKIGHAATWQCYLTVTPELTNPDTCQKLYEAGCRAVQVGLETLSPDTLVREHKRWNKPEVYGKILHNLRDAGIQIHAFLIIGLPGEPLHWGMKWIAFLEQYGEDILTIKASRYRVTRQSPDETQNAHFKWVEMSTDIRPLHLNHGFRYRELSMQQVNAVRTLLEQACRRHWAYGVTSTLPWWANRGRFSWQELQRMAMLIPPDVDVSHLRLSLVKAQSIIKDELGQDVRLDSFSDLCRFARTTL